jgi:hypothetical protein
MRLHNLGPAYVKDGQEAEDSDGERFAGFGKGILLASRGAKKVV